MIVGMPAKPDVEMDSIREALKAYVKKSGRGAIGIVAKQANLSREYVGRFRNGEDIGHNSIRSIGDALKQLEGNSWTESPSLSAIYQFTPIYWGFSVFCRRHYLGKALKMSDGAVILRHQKAPVRRKKRTRTIFAKAGKWCAKRAYSPSDGRYASSAAATWCASSSLLQLHRMRPPA